MLKKEIKIIIIISIFLTHCSTQKRLQQNLDLRYKDYIADKFDSSKEIRNTIEDTLQTWISNRLDIAKSISFAKFQIDSLIIFNSDNKQLVTTINTKVAQKNGTSDDTQILSGRKINDNWYFIQGGTIVLPHNYYHDSLYANYTWDELGCLAYRNFLKGFLKFRDDGSYYVNENAFEAYRTPFGPKSELSEVQKDSLIIDYINGTRQKIISDKEYKEIEESIKNSVHPPEPPKDPNDKTVKIFESKAWKNRYKKK